VRKRGRASYRGHSLCGSRENSHEGGHTPFEHGQMSVFCRGKRTEMPEKREKKGSSGSLGGGTSMVSLLVEGRCRESPNRLHPFSASQRGRKDEVSIFDRGRVLLRKLAL